MATQPSTAPTGFTVETSDGLDMVSGLWASGNFHALLGALWIPRGHQRSSQQGVRILVEMIERDEARGIFERASGFALRQACHRRLVEDGLRRRCQAGSFAEEPQVEAGCGFVVQALEQDSAQARHAHRLRPRSAEDDARVERCARRQFEPDRIAFKRGLRPDQTPKFRNVPSQCAQRVISLGKEYLGQPMARRRTPREHKVGEQSPDFVATRRYIGRIGPAHGRASQQKDRKARSGLAHRRWALALGRAIMGRVRRSG